MMRHNYKKLWLIFTGTAITLSASFFVGHSANLPREPRDNADTTTREPTDRDVKAGLLLTERRINAKRSIRKIRSPAFEAGTMVERSTRDALETFLSDAEVRASDRQLRDYFPDTNGVNRWVRASLIFSLQTQDREMTPEQFAFSEQIYSQILAGEDTSVASLDAALMALPREEGLLRRNSVRILSDLAMKHPELRDPVKKSLLNEAHRAGSRPEGAAAIAALLRINPTREWFIDVNRTYGRLYPGSDLSDFVALKVVSL